MAPIWEVTFEWTGMSGLSGFTNHHYEAPAGTGTEALAAVTRSRAFFQALGTQFPGALTITPHTDVKLLDDVSGDIISLWTVSGPAPVTGGGGTGQTAMPAGGAIAWLTGVVHGKHLMVGRTFLVPMVYTAYTQQGNMSPASLTNMATASGIMLAAGSPRFGVWGRPKYTKSVGGVRTRTLDGLWAPVTSSRALSKVVVLRSRRD